MIIPVKFREQSMRIDARFNTLQVIEEESKIEPYRGATEVIPDDERQILTTAGKVVAKNITVEAIPYFEVSNQYGGKTVIIGG